LRIEHGPDGSDEPVTKQALHPLAGAGRRQADSGCEIERGAATVLLQQPQQAAVDGIKLIGFMIHVRSAPVV
jgi:hypothetical protein